MKVKEYKFDEKVLKRVKKMWERRTGKKWDDKRFNALVDIFIKTYSGQLLLTEILKQPEMRGYTASLLYRLEDVFLMMLGRRRILLWAQRFEIKE